MLGVKWRTGGDTVENEEQKYLSEVHLTYHEEWKWKFVDNSNNP